MIKAYDEMFDSNGFIRQHYQVFSEWLNRQDKKLSLVSNPKKLGQVGVIQGPSGSRKASNSKSVKPAAKRA